MNIYPVTTQDFDKAVALLQQNNLPVDDLSATTQLFSQYHNKELAGVVGLETYGEEGLLRSLCVSPPYRSYGSGQALLHYIETQAKAAGIKTMYLLTTTAAGYFIKKGYKIIQREDVPHSIQQSTEFGTVCPASATVMKKSLV